MTTKPEKKPSYLKKILCFYFAPVWQSFFSIFYLVFFFYFSVFHSGKILVAFDFLLYTFINSSSILTLDYLFWGVVFIMGLIIPFAISLYAIVLFYEIWRGSWLPAHKVLTTISIILAVPLIIILMDNVTRISGGQDALQQFITLNKIWL